MGLFSSRTTKRTQWAQPAFVMKRSTKASRHCGKPGHRVAVQALVYGSVGCTAQESKKVLTKELGIVDPRSWAIRRAISTDCIRHSYHIWGLQLAGNGT